MQAWSGAWGKERKQWRYRFPYQKTVCNLKNPNQNQKRIYELRSLASDPEPLIDRCGSWDHSKLSVIKVYVKAETRK